MDELREIAHLLLRWIHVIAAIAWIGHAFIFNEWDETLIPPDDEKERDKVQGELWMVHGGGFYQLVKHKAFPAVMRGPLHWFKWEAGFTWLSGFFLLSVLYYMGGGIYLVDPSVSDISVGAAIGVGIGLLVGSWLVYDLTWATVGQKSEGAGIAVTLALIIGATFGVAHVLSGRAAFIHVGAMLATWMAANVWIRIIPNMTKMVSGAKPGDKLDPEHSRLAKQRSKHNNYFTYPVIFVMISNHYPVAYGHPNNWVILLGIMMAAAGVKHLMNVKRAAPSGLLAIATGLAIVFGATLKLGGGDEPEPVASTAGAPGPKPHKALDAATAARLTVRVDLSGPAPERKELKLAGGCEALHTGPVYDDSLVVTDGHVKNAFVWLEGDLGGYSFPAATEQVLVDQTGCLYEPHVVGVRVGQTVVFNNSDALFHNVRSIAEANEVFNEVTPTKGARFEKVFKRPETMVQAKCDVHPWMKAFIGVLPHPFFGTSGEGGGVALEGIPPGRYTVHVWHEILGEKTGSVELTAGASADLALSYAGAP